MFLTYQLTHQATRIMIFNVISHLNVPQVRHQETFWILSACFTPLYFHHVEQRE